MAEETSKILAHRQWVLILVSIAVALVVARAVYNEMSEQDTIQRETSPYEVLREDVSFGPSGKTINTIVRNKQTDTCHLEVRKYRYSQPSITTVECP